MIMMTILYIQENSFSMIIIDQIHSLTLCWRLCLETAQRCNFFSFCWKIFDELGNSLKLYIKITNHLLKEFRDKNSGGQGTSTVFLFLDLWDKTTALEIGSIQMEYWIHSDALRHKPIYSSRRPNQNSSTIVTSSRIWALYSYLK